MKIRKCFVSKKYLSSFRREPNLPESPSKFSVGTSTVQNVTDRHLKESRYNEKLVKLAASNLFFLTTKFVNLVDETNASHEQHTDLDKKLNAYLRIVYRALDTIDPGLELRDIDEYESETDIDSVKVYALLYYLSLKPAETNEGPYKQALRRLNALVKAPNSALTNDASFFSTDGAKSYLKISQNGALIAWEELLNTPRDLPSFLYELQAAKNYQDNPEETRLLNSNCRNINTTLMDMSFSEAFSCHVIADFQEMELSRSCTTEKQKSIARCVSPSSSLHTTLVLNPSFQFSKNSGRLEKLLTQSYESIKKNESHYSWTFIEFCKEYEAYLTHLHRSYNNHSHPFHCEKTAKNIRFVSANCAVFIDRAATLYHQGQWTQFLADNSGIFNGFFKYDISKYLPTTHSLPQRPSTVPHVLSLLLHSDNIFVMSDLGLALVNQVRLMALTVPPTRHTSFLKPLFPGIHISKEVEEKAGHLFLLLSDVDKAVLNRILNLISDSQANRFMPKDLPVFSDSLRTYFQSPPAQGCDETLLLSLYEGAYLSGQKVSFLSFLNNLNTCVTKHYLSTDSFREHSKSLLLCISSFLTSCKPLINTLNQLGASDMTDYLSGVTFPDRTNSNILRQVLPPGNGVTNKPTPTIPLLIFLNSLPLISGALFDADTANLNPETLRKLDDIFVSYTYEITPPANSNSKEMKRPLIQKDPAPATTLLCKILKLQPNLVSTTSAQYKSAIRTLSEISIADKKKICLILNYDLSPGAEPTGRVTLASFPDSGCCSIM